MPGFSKGFMETANPWRSLNTVDNIGKKMFLYFVDKTKVIISVPIHQFKYQNEVFIRRYTF